jgi:large subunit ribosomal protein L6
MSRVARNPVVLPQGVTATVEGSNVTVKGAKGTLKLPLRQGLSLVQEGQVVRVEVAERNREALMHAGSLRSHLANVVQGVSKGYERKLELVGVGYRAAAQGKKLNLTLGFSHPVEYDVPEGITVETPTQTEILVKGADKQQVGQVAAEIRAYRSPEPYKGKGVRYSGERIELKETKKK